MRFFAFGCSFTNYNIWPTWADIIATDLDDIEYYNYGVQGLGNQGIQARIVEADMRHKLTSDDIIIILWSTWSREDRFLNNHWSTAGSIFNNHFFDDMFINKYWSWENDIIKNSTAIHMTTRAYKDVITYQGTMTTFPTINNNTDLNLNKLVNKIFGIDDDHITKFYKDKLVMPPCWNQGVNSQFSGTSYDNHPDVKHHLSYVQNTLYPVLGYKLKDSTVKMFTDLQDELTRVFKLSDDGEMLAKKSAPILLKYNIKKSSI